MRTSNNGVFALAMSEGIVPAPYLDSVGVWTFGIGHTAAAGIPDPAKMARGNPANLDGAVRVALRVFRDDLASYEAAVTRALRVPVEQHEFDALVSFHFNTGGIGRATLTRLLNEGDKAGAAEAFMGWRRPPEIIPRRQAEQRLFRGGVYPSGRVPIYSVTGSNSPGSVVAQMTKGELLALLPDRSPAPRPEPRPTQGSGGIVAAIMALLRRITGGRG